MNIQKIVITGGPCAGKSTAMSLIQKTFQQMGYTVLFINESATELIMGGVAPWTCKNNQEYQRLQMILQQQKEMIFEEASIGMDAEKILIVCDRGMLDNKAYMSEEAFLNVCQQLNTNEITLRDQYDAIFHLVSAAKGAESFYTTANNEARKESIEEAAYLDDQLINAYSGYPHFRIIDNQGSFEHKMKRLIQEIALFLGEPMPLEIERKFLIAYPDLNLLKTNPTCKKIEIIQTYLISNEHEERRVRQRGSNGHYVYYETIKRKIDGLKRIEVERRISQNEYLDLLMQADTSKKAIRKDRYCFIYHSQYFEIDIYPFWQNQAILEIELSNEHQVIDFPEYIKIIKEVTYDPSYKNQALASL